MATPRPWLKAEFMFLNYCNLVYFNSKWMHCKKKPYEKKRILSHCHQILIIFVCQIPSDSCCSFLCATGWTSPHSAVPFQQIPDCIAIYTNLHMHSNSTRYSVSLADLHPNLVWAFCLYSLFFPLLLLLFCLFHVRYFLSQMHYRF